MRRSTIFFVNKVIKRAAFYVYVAVWRKKALTSREFSEAVSDGRNLTPLSSEQEGSGLLLMMGMAALAMTLVAKMAVGMDVWALFSLRESLLSLRSFLCSACAVDEDVAKDDAVGTKSESTNPNVPDSVSFCKSCEEKNDF